MQRGLPLCPCGQRRCALTNYLQEACSINGGVVSVFLTNFAHFMRYCQPFFDVTAMGTGLILRRLKGMPNGGVHSRSAMAGLERLRAVAYLSLGCLHFSRYP